MTYNNDQVDICGNLLHNIDSVCGSPSVVNFEDIEGTEELMIHLKAIRYNVDSKYASWIDSLKEQKRLRERKQAYKNLIMTNDWYFYAKEYLQYLIDIRERNLDSRNNYLRDRKDMYNSGSFMTSIFEDTYIPELDFEEYCTRKVMHEYIQDYVRSAHLSRYMNY